MPPKKNKRTRHHPRETKGTEESPAVTAGQKRKASKITGNNEKDGKSAKKIKDDHDKYCFICHKLSQEKLCSTCPRAYHDKCIATARKFINSQCFQCQQEETARKEFKRIPYSKLKESLLDVIQKVTPNDKIQFQHISNWPGDHDYLCYVMDIERMIDKCRDEEHHYESPVELLGDFKWILHNCAIIFGENSSHIKTAKDIIQKCQFELDDLLDCFDCYRKKKNAEKFVKFCNPPHPIVWAKVKGYAYWPAKCLRVVDGHAHVRFFYTHQSASQVKDCLFMSKNYPKIKGQRKPTGLKFSSAMDELNDYIEKFKSKYGPFPYEPQNEVFNYEKGMKTMKEIHNKILALATKKSKRPTNSVTIANGTNSSNVVIDLTDEENAFTIKSSPPLSPTRTGEDITVIGSVENNVDPALNGTLKEVVVKSEDTLHEGDIVEANNVCVGRLFPGNHRKNIDASSSESTFHALDETNLPVQFSGRNSPEQFSEASILIKNVISAVDVPQLLNLQEHSESSDSQVSYPVIISSVSEFQKQPQNNIIDSNVPASPVKRLSSQQLTPNKTTFPQNITSIEDEDDDDIIVIPPSNNTGDTSVNDMAMSMIAATDPNSNEMLNKSIEILKDHMVQFWLRACGTPNLVNLVQNKDSKINSLKEEKQKLKATISELEEKCKEIRKNATLLLNNTTMNAWQKIHELEQQKAVLEQQKADLEQQNKELIDKLNNKSYSPPSNEDDQEIQTDVISKQMLSLHERTADSLLQAKLKPYLYQENQTVQTFHQQQCVIQQLVTTLPTTVPQQAMGGETVREENTSVRASMSNACTSVYACTSTRERVSITSNKTTMSRSDKKTGKESD